MNYPEAKQKKILRSIENELLALLVVDPASGEYEVLYSDASYREFPNRYHRKDFFQIWEKTGISFIYEPDRPRMQQEISRDNLETVLREADAFVTRCRFMIHEVPAWCRIRVIHNPEDPGTCVISIRNIDREYRLEMDRMDDLEELQETVKQMRMKNSISQMHPHFLYNALSSIREIVLTDPECGADLLYDFTTHLRASIRAMSNDEKIWFSRELENIKAYVNIEKMRFGDRLNVEYVIQTSDFRIIPLSIQPLVENAVKHGLYEKGPDGGTVTIRTAERSGCVEITVEDDGVGFDIESVRQDVIDGKRDSTGLYNLFFRLETMMQAKVELESRIGEGTKAVIRIPKSV